MRWMTIWHSSWRPLIAEPSEDVMSGTHQDISQLYREHSRPVMATLIRLLGSFDLAEEAMQEAFAAAVNQWTETGAPDHPVAWLIRTGHRRGIDLIRRGQTARRYAHLVTEDDVDFEPWNEDGIQEDQLRLIFTCCHPALSIDARVALTLREMCGLTTEQVARALLQKPATLAQRIVRAKKKIRDAAIPYEVPDSKELSERLPGVLRVIYLVFNEGYSRSDGYSVTDSNLSAEAIRLAEHLAGLLPQGEVFGLLALMLLHDSRRLAREDANGDLVTLEDQDRSVWDRDQIRRGLHWLSQALALSPASAYTLQASIAAEHAIAGTPADTNWRRIVRLYEALQRQHPSPVIALNHAVSVAMCDGPAAGLILLDKLQAIKDIQAYHLFHAARADLFRRADDVASAIESYQRAIQLVSQAPEKRFLERRLRALSRES